MKANQYEAAMKPEVWPFRVGVWHYKAPRRTDRPEAGWKGQASRAGGRVEANQSRGLGAGGQGNLVPGQAYPVGHPSKAKQHQQFMESRQPGPVEMSNFWNVLASLGEMGTPNA